MTADDPAEPRAVVRRAPFADNPAVGVRGQQAQARILDAALQVFGELGYHGCAVQRITEASGCSRVSFYQYFSSKEDLFRHLAGQVAHQLTSLTMTLRPITPGAEGWEALHGWLDAYADLYDRYEPVFITFQTAAASDTDVATGAARVAQRTFRGIRSKIEGSALSSRQIDDVVRILLDSVARANRMSALLEAAAPDDAADRRGRLDTALADVFHRALFGVDPAVNVHEPAPSGPSPVAAAPADDAGAGAGAGEAPELGDAARFTRDLLIEKGQEVFAERGFYATRVVDIMNAAGMSHGVFYRYFASKTDLFRVIAERAGRRMSEALGEIPAIAPPGAKAATRTARAADLRAWLGRYASAYAAEASILAMWIEAMSYGHHLGTASASAIERGRAAMEEFLQPRGFGDVETEAVVLLVFLDAMTGHPTTPDRIESFAGMIERGLLTAPRPTRATRVARKQATASGTGRGRG